MFRFPAVFSQWVLYRMRAVPFLCFTLLCASHSVWAHTYFDPRQVTEGRLTRGVLILPHVCEALVNGKPRDLPVIAQSLLIPTVNPKLSRSDGRSISDLGQVIEQGALSGFITPFFDSSTFQKHRLKKDSLGNSVGFGNWKGRLPHGYFGQIPVMIQSLNFVSTSCANQLIVEFGGADICRVTAVPADGDANLWIPSTTPRFPDANVHGVGEPMPLVINRDLALNPLRPRCSGKEFSVTVSPSPEDIDANLPIKGYWPAP